MANWLTTIYREVRPNALWDLIKFMVIAGISLLAVLVYRLWVYLRQFPQDLVVDLAIFGGAFILLTGAYALTKLRNRRALIPPSNQGLSDEPSPAKPQEAVPKKKGNTVREHQTLIVMTPERLASVFRKLPLGESYTEQEVEGWKDWIGQWVEVSGPINEKANLPTQFYVQIGLRESGYRSVIGMTFSRAWADRLSELSSGSRITVRGQIKDFNPMVVRLGNCELVDS